VFVAAGSQPDVPFDAVRIELHSRKAKMLARVDLKTDPERAVVFQKQFKLAALGSPEVAPTAPMATFGNKDLIGVELVENVDTVLASALDVSPIAAQMQARVGEIGQQARDPEQRTALDALIKSEVVPQFL